MFFTDRAKIGSVRQTDDGYTIAVAKAVRTGVQQYLASELGLPGNGVVNVYRPPEEVFSEDSLRSFSHAPVTLGHPKEAVTADNWSELAVGEVSTEAKVDGEWVSLPLILKDKRVTRQPWRELSAGYSCEIVAEDGVTPQGEPYTHKQTNIKINHLAIVDKARAGAEARIGDDAHKWGASPITKEVPRMELKTVVLGDEAVQIIADDASKVEAFKQKLNDSEGKVGELTAKIAELEAQVLSDAEIDKRVADRMKLVDQARSVHADVVVDGKTDAEIMREVVVAKFGDAATADMSDAAIAGMFRAACIAAPADDTVRNAVKDGAKETPDYAKRMADAAKSFLHPKKGA